MLLIWNTAQISRIIEELRKTGTKVDEKHLALISPLLHAHVIPNGTYRFVPDQELEQIPILEDPTV